MLRLSCCIGTWESVPVLIGYKIVVVLPEKGSPIVTYRTPLEPIHYKPIDPDATEGKNEGSG